MNLLKVLFFISGILIFILALDVARKQKFNALHFVVFFWVSIWLFVFTFFPNLLNIFWRFFWLQRWADVLVYCSILFLFYFTLLLLDKVEQNRSDLTDLVREIALDRSVKREIKGRYVFVIPAYNEWKVIYENINKILKKYENIIVINDWSKDNTLSELKKFWEKIIILNHFKNRWQWRALETWFEYIRRYWEKIEYVITFDADWQHDLEDIKIFEKEIKKHPWVLVFLWSRFLWQAKNISLSRKILLKLWILFTFFVSNLKLTDVHNGYRIIKKEALKDIKITIDWMSHASELIDIIWKNKIPFMEVPVNIKYTDYSLWKWQKSLNAINIVFKMIWNKFFR